MPPSWTSSSPPGYTSYGSEIRIAARLHTFPQLEGMVPISPVNSGEPRQPPPGSRLPSLPFSGALRLMLLAFLLPALFVLSGCSLQSSQGRAPESPQPDQAPGFTGKLFTGEEVSLAQFRGKVVFLNFWASWCGPCRRETPMIEAMWKDYKKTDDVLFLGVNIQDTKANAQAFMDEFKLSYPNIFDPPAKIAYQYGVTALPSTFIIDKKGGLAERFIGALEGPGADEASLRKIIDRLRKES